ncbi:AAA family ATPase [Bacteroides caecigallinarum]|uniref:ATP-dependent DNA helicase n=1 Tax=Bacteroides TaxID=816 RepID=UPI001958095E|nr:MULTISPECIES: AAA family ATPase [Bacteroides]MBM6959619.1 AAA family ATPase [Bacteroides caecigallinarum]MCR8892766.1 AAA family ATPase [Bacteroides sp. ET336]MDN0057263.1 AAA family ATPase [Bacteroides caecigallinarum]MDN0072911.1 AAA family ATPase [Bacteroides caecigallinarum]
MLNNYLTQQIKRNFCYQPTEEQEKAIECIADFLFKPENDTLLLLKGYAGTGKTTLIGAVVRTLSEMRAGYVLMASTGRAAKVFSRYSGFSAYTIHKKIYRQKSFSNDLDNFSLNDNLHKNTLFIVDEASMISNDGLTGASFGSGRLLDDLIEYVYAGQGCRLLIIGDDAQLPPVGEDESPALSAEVLSGYGLDVTECILTEVIRYSGRNGILSNATMLRERMAADDIYDLPVLTLKGYEDISSIPGSELIEAINSSYNEVGMDETMVICRSNKRAYLYNKGIRNTILYREEELSTGDILMIAKNNYHWTADCKEMDFIANGDIAVVRRVRRTQEMYGFRFADVVLSFPDHNDIEFELKILLDTLHSDYPSLSKEDSDRLFNAVMEDYSDITNKKERMKKLKEDSFYNALQVKYAYAVTCHKAQGGQWKRIFIDQGYITEDTFTPDYYRWLYTALTRASEKLYLVNWPESQTE